MKLKHLKALMFLGAFSLLFLQAKMFLQTDVHTHTRTVLWMFDRRRRLSNEIISNLIDISFLSKDEPQHPTPLGLLLCQTQPGKYSALLYFVSQKDLPRQGHCFQGSNTCGGKCYLKHAITRHFAGQWLSSSAALERAQYCCLRKDNSLEIQTRSSGDMWYAQLPAQEQILPAQEGGKEF